MDRFLLHVCVFFCLFFFCLVCVNWNNRSIAFYTLTNTDRVCLCLFGVCVSEMIFCLISFLLLFCWVIPLPREQGRWLLKFEGTICESTPTKGLWLPIEVSLASVFSLCGHAFPVLIWIYVSIYFWVWLCVCSLHVGLWDLGHREHIHATLAKS